MADVRGRALAFKRKLIDRLVRRAFATAFPVVSDASAPLAEHMTAAIGPDQDGDANGFLHLPHYWAVYIHDGRGPFGPRTRRFLVWFPNPEDDPRLSPEPPVRLAQVRSLLQVWSSREWAAALQENARRRKLGVRPYMVIAKFQPLALRGKFFFTKGMGAFESEAPGIIRTEFDRFVRSLLEEKSGTIPIRLRA